jgi:hypothetical protein
MVASSTGHTKDRWALQVSLTRVPYIYGTDIVYFICAEILALAVDAHSEVPFIGHRGTTAQELLRFAHRNISRDVSSSTMTWN